MPDEVSPESKGQRGDNADPPRPSFEERLDKALEAILSGAVPTATPVSPSRPTGKPIGLKAIPATVKGDEVANRLSLKLEGMLGTTALIRANRRRATAIDTTDYEAAFDDLVNPNPRPKWLDVLADIATLFGGGFLGYAINVMTGEKPDITKISITLLAGLLLGIGAIVIKSKKID